VSKSNSARRFEKNSLRAFPKPFPKPFQLTGAQTYSFCEKSEIFSFLPGIPLHVKHTSRYTRTSACVRALLNLSGEFFLCYGETCFIRFLTQNSFHIFLGEVSCYFLEVKIFSFMVMKKKEFLMLVRFVVTKNKEFLVGWLVVMDGSY